MSTHYFIVLLIYKELLLNEPLSGTGNLEKTLACYTCSKKGLLKKPCCFSKGEGKVNWGHCDVAYF